MFLTTDIISGTIVLVSKEDSLKLDNCMFVVQGNWETGYVYDEQIFFMIGVTTCYKVGESSAWINIPETTTLYLEWIKQERSHLFNQRVSRYSDWLYSAQSWPNHPRGAYVSLTMMERCIGKYYEYEYDPLVGSTNFLSCDL